VSFLKVELCAIGALAAYFFQRFNVDNEAFPNLKHPKSWYAIKVFRASGKKIAGRQLVKAPTETESQRQFPLLISKPVRKHIYFVSVSVRHHP
jgi:hypothetical protein